MKRNCVLWIFILLMYLEIFFHVSIFGIYDIFNVYLLYSGLFNLIISLIIGLLTNRLSNTLSKCINLFIIAFFCVWFGTIIILKNIFNTFFSIYLFRLVDQAAAFTGASVLEVLKYWYIVLLALVPFIILFIFRNKIDFGYVKKKNKKVIKQPIYKKLFILGIAIIAIVLAVNINKNTHNLFYNVENIELNMKTLGLNTSTFIDINRAIFSFNSKIKSETINKDAVKEFAYNNLDIDFASLISNESKSALKDMHNYFKNQEGTLKNEYTGIYKDKNLVLVMGESLNTIAISEKYTPTLYKLSHEGFVFNNFYTPVNYSTIGGEFQDLTGLFANLSMLSTRFRKGSNAYPMGIARLFNQEGYNTYAYHNNAYNFQSRDVYLKSLGFNNYIGCGNGLEKKIQCNTWPQSDLDMVNVTYEDYIKDKHFFTYYVSVSGHMPWNFSGNAMSIKNKSLVESAPYSSEAKAYIAANIELDKAMELLIDKLDKEGILDDTVIVIVPDHYPYDMNIDTINELSDFKRDLKIGVNKSTLIIWNNKQEKVEIDKVCSQLDVLPTIYNLFGLDYDSRLIMGKDILSTEEGIAYFNDHSFVTNKATYYAATGRVDGDVSSEYIEKTKNIVDNRINMSKLIMEHDYYRKVIGD